MPDLRNNHSAIFDALLILGGLGGLLFLLFEMNETGFLNPFLVAAATVILLWPLRNYRAVKAILMSGGFLFVIWFLSELRGILIPFGAVYLLAYLFNPVVNWLDNRYNVPRWASATGITLFSVGLIVLFFLLLVPSIINELEILANRLITFLANIQQLIQESEIIDYLAAYNLVNREVLESQVAEFLPQQISTLASTLPSALQGLSRSVTSITGTLVIITVAPVLLFYMLKDFLVIERRLIELFPTFRGRRDYILTAGQLVGKYLRGLLTISVIAAFNVSVGLLLLDVPFALLIGLFGGVMNMIPNFGIVITNIVGVLIAVIFGDPWLITALSVIGVLMAESILETTVLTPNIMSYQVGVHPVLVILSLFVFGYFMGFLGLLIAVPTTAILVMLYRTYRTEIVPELYKDAHSFQSAEQQES